MRIRTARKIGKRQRLVATEKIGTNIEVIGLARPTV